MQQHQQSHHQQQQQDTTEQPKREHCSRVWLPHKQLWVPDANGAPAAANNGSDDSTASTTAQLQRVFMAAAAVSNISRPRFRRYGCCIAT
jgi:hypothetical protein